MSKFVTIGLLGRLNSESTQYSLQRLIRYLSKHPVAVILDQEIAPVMQDAGLKVASREQLAKLCDLIIVVGGDGSLLAAGRAFAGSGVKILGINRGRLGFLTDITPEQIEYKVGEVLEGKYQLEERFLLTSSVLRDGKVIASSLALNDVVLHPGKFIRMIEFSLLVDDEFVYRLRADGLIISSPTGSTAYALSGGGPIMHPSLDAIALVPMSPHTLSSRPIVVGGDSRIAVLVSKDNRLNPHVTCDGQIHTETEPGDIVQVSKSVQPLQLIHPIEHDFYDICRTKLGWANQAGDHH